MKQILALLLLGMVLFSGCIQEEEQPAAAPEVPEELESQEPEAQPEEEPEVVPEEPEEVPKVEDPTYTSTAHSQEDCSMLAPDCESCLAKKNCGWCKESNSCHYGDESGPETAPCKADEWAYDLNSCSVVDAGESCADLTNCVACLSGSGCQWCIQGSVCGPEGTSEECFGGWKTESYECNYASR